jgi:hypothetical protein
MAVNTINVSQLINPFQQLLQITERLTSSFDKFIKSMSGITGALRNSNSSTMHVATIRTNVIYTNSIIGGNGQRTSLGQEATGQTIGEGIARPGKNELDKLNKLTDQIMRSGVIQNPTATQGGIGIIPGQNINTGDARLAAQQHLGLNDASGEGGGGALGGIGTSLGVIGTALGVAVVSLYAFSKALESAVSFTKLLNPALVQQYNIALANLGATVGTAFEPLIEALIPITEVLSDELAPIMAELGPIIKDFVITPLLVFGGVLHDINELFRSFGWIGNPGRSVAVQPSTVTDLQSITHTLAANAYSAGFRSGPMEQTAANTARIADGVEDIRNRLNQDTGPDRSPIQRDEQGRRRWGFWRVPEAGSGI